MGFVISWLAGSRIGRWVAIGLLAISLAAVALLALQRSAESTGRAKERIDAIAKTLEVVDAMRRAAPADRAGMRRRLAQGRWAD